MFLHIFRFWLGTSHLGRGKNSSKPIISYILVEWTSIKAPAIFMWTELDTRVLISQINGISGVGCFPRNVLQRHLWRWRLQEKLMVGLVGTVSVVKTTQNLPWNQVLTFEEDFGSVRICQNLRSPALDFHFSSKGSRLLRNGRFVKLVGFLFRLVTVVTVQDCFMWIFSFCYTIFCCVYVALFIANLNGKDHWRLGGSMGDSGFRCGSVDQPFWFLKSTLYTWYYYIT